MNHKEIAQNFQEMIIDNRVSEAYQKYVSDDFTHHNPYFEGTREALLKAMLENAENASSKQFEAKMILEDDDKVMIYSHIKQNPEDIGFSAVHIFRFQNDKIVELWDLVQMIPNESINRNGLF